MKTVVVLLTFFIQGQVESNSVRCCYPRQYTQKYRTEGSTVETLVMVDHDQKIEMHRDGPNGLIYIEDFGKQTFYTKQGGTCSKEPTHTDKMPDIPCIPENAVFLRNVVENGQTLHVLNYALTNGYNITSTVNLNTCFPFRQHIIPKQGFPQEMHIEYTESSASILYPALLEIPSDCT